MPMYRSELVLDSALYMLCHVATFPEVMGDSLDLQATQ